MLTVISIFLNEGVEYIFGHFGSKQLFFGNTYKKNSLKTRFSLGFMISTFSHTMCCSVDYSASYCLSCYCSRCSPSYYYWDCYWDYCSDYCSSYYLDCCPNYCSNCYSTRCLNSHLNCCSIRCSTRSTCCSFPCCSLVHHPNLLSYCSSHPNLGCSVHSTNYYRYFHYSRYYCCCSCSQGLLSNSANYCCCPCWPNCCGYSKRLNSGWSGRPWIWTRHGQIGMEHCLHRVLGSSCSKRCLRIFVKCYIRIKKMKFRVGILAD